MKHLSLSPNSVVFLHSVSMTHSIPVNQVLYLRTSCVVYLWALLSNSSTRLFYTALCYKGRFLLLFLIKANIANNKSSFSFEASVSIHTEQSCWHGFQDCFQAEAKLECWMPCLLFFFIFYDSSHFKLEYRNNFERTFTKKICPVCNKVFVCIIKWKKVPKTKGRLAVLQKLLDI